MSMTLRTFRERGLETGSREHNFTGMSALDGNSMAWQEVDRKYKELRVARKND